MAASFSWPSGSKVDRPDWFAAGTASAFEIDQPVHFADQGFWLVRRAEAEFLALYEKDPHLGCSVPWRSEFEFMGLKGWFRNPCHGETYDLDGRCYAGPCPRGLDRFRVRVVNGEVMVDTSRVIPGPALGAERQPVY